MSAVLLLSTFWEVARDRRRRGAGERALRPQPPPPPEVAARILDTLAFLQLCRMRLTLYSMLLQSVLAFTAGSPEVGGQR